MEEIMHGKIPSTDCSSAGPISAASDEAPAVSDVSKVQKMGQRFPAHRPRHAASIFLTLAALAIAYFLLMLWAPERSVSDAGISLHPSIGEASARATREPALSSHGFLSQPEPDYAAEREVTRTKDVEPPIATF